MDPQSSAALIIGATSITTAVVTKALEWWRGHKKDKTDNDSSRLGIENKMRDVYGQMVADLVDQVNRLQEHLRESDLECERRMARLQKRICALEKHQKDGDV